MARILKAFAVGPEQKSLADYGSVIARYDAFAIVEVARGKGAALAARFPCEDVTDQYKIALGGKSAVPPGVAAKRTAKRSAATKLPSSGFHHYLVQFVGPVKRTWLSRVSAAGGALRELYSDFTYIVRANAKAVAAMEALPFVRWVGHLPYDARISSGLRAHARGAKAPTLPRTRLRTGVYTVQAFDKAHVGTIAAAARRLGFEVLSRSPAAHSMVLRSRGDLKQRSRLVQTLSTVHGVKFIRSRSIMRTSNDVAPEFMGAIGTATSPVTGLSGRGEIIGICDTGLDTGDPATIHPDFAKRILAIKSYPITQDFASDVFNAGGDDGPADVDSGHGTHVAGSVLGSGKASAGITPRPVRGLAHRARLVFQAVEQEMWWRPSVPAADRERYILAGIPNDLGPLFGYAYGKGARIHSNSWGGGDPGEYDEQCDQLDRFIWTHKDFCVVVAAGNDGTDKDGDGKINLKSVTSPGTAKNCITIGACENLRPEFNSETYGRWWPQDYPVAPYKNGPMADNPDQVVAFSSRGPTSDGRIKPDVIAPGTFILSTRSSQIASNNSGWRAFAGSRQYFYMGGTSMATPLVAGAAALVREYHRKKRKNKKPSAALIKATLIAGARRLPGTAPAGGVADNHQGYGRVDLGAVLDAKTLFIEVSPGLATGQMYGGNFRVASGTRSLRVTLCYSDYPGPTLVNNLNLILTAPDGSKVTSMSGAGAALALDSKNNVEVIEVNAPAGGTWRIDVVGSNVPQGPQDCAIVILGATATN
jgi:subtilisin family serine protease